LLSFGEIEQLTGYKTGEFHTVCPVCGPKRSLPRKSKLRVLKIWRNETDFATFACAHCGLGGYAFRDGASKIDKIDHARLKAEAAGRAQDYAARQLEKARWLWSMRQPIGGSIAETYLREARKYHGPLPGTLGFLPARGEHGPAMIAAFGLPNEPESGELTIANEAALRVERVSFEASKADHAERLAELERLRAVLRVA
jgi:hypothetical protein